MVGNQGTMKRGASMLDLVVKFDERRIELYCPTETANTGSGNNSNNHWLN